MATIESGKYEETRRKFAREPIVQKLAVELAEGIKAGHVSLEKFTHADASPRFEFMQAANSQYEKLGGTKHGHIGAVAEAIVGLVQWLTTPGAPPPFGIGKEGYGA